MGVAAPFAPHEPLAARYVLSELNDCGGNERREHPERATRGAGRHVQDERIEADVSGHGDDVLVRLDGLYRCGARVALACEHRRQHRDRLVGERRMKKRLDVALQPTGGRRHRRVLWTVRHQAGRGRNRSLASWGAEMADPSQSVVAVVDGRSYSGPSGRSAGGVGHADRPFHPSNGEMTQENQSPEIPARFTRATGSCVVGFNASLKAHFSLDKTGEVPSREDVPSRTSRRTSTFARLPSDGARQSPGKGVRARPGRSWRSPGHRPLGHGNPSQGVRSAGWRVSAFGEGLESAVDHGESRIGEIRAAAERILSAPLRGERHDDIVPGLRYLANRRPSIGFEPRPHGMAGLLHGSDALSAHTEEADRGLSGSARRWSAMPLHLPWMQG